MQQKRLDRITKVVKNRIGDIVLVLEDIHDPHNVAAILRTCDAMGIQSIHIIFEKEKRYNPRRIGKATSSSANKWLDFEIYTSTISCLAKLKDQGFTIVATALTYDSVSLSDYKVGREKIALVIGNEHSGVSQTVLETADQTLQIPMAGFVQSLNVSVACAIILWELTKQKRSKSGWETPLDKQNTLLETLIERAG